MNLARAIQGMKDVDLFVTETKVLFREGQFTPENIEARKIWLKYFIEHGAEMVIALTEAAQELEREYNGKTIAEHG